MRSLIAGLSALLPFVAACNGSSLVSTAGGSGGCRITLSGAVDFSDIPCRVNVGADTNGDGKGIILIGAPAPPAGYQIVASVATVGGPSLATYSDGDGNSVGTCDLYTDPSAATARTWLASNNPAIAVQGSYRATLNQLGTEFVQSPDAAQFDLFSDPHGSLGCTMPAFAGTSASGTTMMTVTF